METGQPLNKHHVLQALIAIHTQGANPNQIKIANDFLTQCEAHTFFSTTLLSIYSEATDYQLQMSSLILLTNVIKRNWNAKRATTNVIKPEVKEELRRGLLQAYFLHDLRNYKHFNALLSYLTRLEYPSQYGQLHQFVINSLTQLTEMIKTDVGSVLKSNRVLVVLSTCKVILKEYNIKKIAHNQDSFLQYIAGIIQISVPLSQQIYLKIKSSFESGDQNALIGLFECLRKIDKVILYGLGSMPSLYQYKAEIKPIVGSFVSRVEEFNTLFDQLVNQSVESLCEQIEKYFTGVVQQLGRLQNYFPFIFSDFLREYLYLILKMLIQNVPKPKYYQSQKLLSAIITTNFKPLTSFAYYQTAEEFKNSIYSRKKADFDNIQLQQHCHLIFRQVYSPETVSQLLQALIGEIMTAPHVLVDYKEFHDDLVLQDVEIAIVDQPGDTSVYDNCITLVRNLIKCFKAECLPVVIAMVNNVQQLKFRNDAYSRQMLANILEIVLVLPHIYDAEQLPIQQICSTISAVYEANRFSYLSRIIRKYHRSLPTETVRKCFEILARVVATPINGSITPQIIYQSALGLKTLMNEMESQNVPIEVLASCISNIVSLVKLKEFTLSPTLLWPIINLLIRLVKSLFDINRDVVTEAVCIIVQGLSSLISSDKNEELLVCALAELISTLFYCSFKSIKEEYPIRGRALNLSQRVQKINPTSLVVFEASLIFMKCNINNRALQNYDTVYRFWLTLMRTYPTVYQQQLYNFQLSDTNSKLAEFFKTQSQQLLGDDPILFLEILEEYFITELIDLSPNELMNIITNVLNDCEPGEKKLRILMASGSLYYSFSLLRSPVMEIFVIFFKELIQLENKISPQVNSLRTLFFLIIGQHSLNSSIVDIYQLFTNSSGGNLGSWFLPYLWCMHFVSNKFAFKLNAAVLLKAIADIGASSFAQILQTQYNNQYAIDEFLKIITIQLTPLNIDFMYNSYHNIYRALLPNELTPDFASVVVFRKTKLHLSDQMLERIVGMELASDLKVHFGEVLKVLDWSSADLQQRIGEKGALELCGYLGWEAKIV